jgi:hypothetical protein
MIRRRLNELDAGTLQRSYRQPKACTSHGDRCTKDAMPSIIPGLATRQALGLPLARAEIVAGDRSIPETGSSAKSEPIGGLEAPALRP